MNMDPLKQIAEALNAGTRCFIIRGAAGTGKTTLIQSLIPLLEGHGLSARLMAPTGRAALILQKRTGARASTIHSGIFNVTDEPIRDEHDDAVKWIFPLRTTLDEEDVAFIVDEASMVGSVKHENDRELFQFGSGALLQDLIQYSGIRESGTTNVLFFVGDGFQLPPVGESSGYPPALNEAKLEELTGFKPLVIELTTVYRQSEGSGILQEAAKLRDALMVRDFSRFSFSSHDDLSMVDEKIMLEVLRLPQRLDDTVIIAHTNERVREYNCEVRGYLKYDSRLPEADERLLCIRNSQVILNDKYVQFYNGDFLRVLSVTDQVFKLNGHYRPKGEKESFSYEYTFQKMSVEWTYEPERGIVEDIWVNISPILDKAWDTSAEYASIGLYNGVKDWIENLLRKKYPDFRKDRGRKNYWDDVVRKYLHSSVLLRAPIVKFGYAVTGHKSQGGEWDYVWADYTFGANLMSEYFFRWAYTVTTRAKKNLYVACPPHIDALGSALTKGTIPQVTNNGIREECPVSEQSVCDCVIHAGFKIREIIPRQWAHRIMLTDNDEMIEGYVDIMYRKNKIISRIDVRVPGTVHELEPRLQGYIGKSIQVIESRPQSVVENSVPVIDVLPSQQATVDRIMQAVKGSPLRLVSAKSLTGYHVRLEFSSAHTGHNGRLDLYFKAKGQVTLGDSTLSEDDMDVLRRGIL